MSTIVQATCPGCQNVLRIPADWVKTPIRCKHCQTVLMPRKPSSNTPSPLKRKSPPPLPSGGNYPETAGRNLPQDVIPASDRAPADVVPTPVKKKRGNAFSDLDGEDEGSDVLSPKRKPRHSSLLVPVIIMGVLLGSAGAALAIFWPQLKAALTGEQPSVAENEHPTKPGSGETKDGGIKEVGTKDTTLTKDVGSKDAGSKDSRVNKDKDVGPKDGMRDGNQTKDGPPPKDPIAGSTPWPRRALIISVHNYLYANPIGSGFLAGQKLTDLIGALNRGLKIPLNEIAHLSDAAGRGAARPPLKSVIEKTLTDFLAGSRTQDRVLVFLIGHCVEIEDKQYFVPIEGDLEDAAGLIPMKWILDEMGKCPARQKILVVDVNRENPTYGKERPGSGPMSEKFQALLKAPPEGVQVWAACSKDGFSYETETQSPGAFVEALLGQLPKGVPGKIQRQPDLIPVEAFNDLVNKELKNHLDPIKLAQVAFVAGKDKDNGVEYDPKEALAKDPVLAPVPGGQNAANVAASKSVLEDIDVPPIRSSKGDNGINFAMLPPMVGAMAEYAPGGDPTKIREKIKAARAVLWAVADTGGKQPADLKALIDAKQKELKVNLSVLRAGYNVPSNENQFKTRVETDERQVAVVLGALTEAHEDLKELADMKEKESKRWQANYDFIVAHLEAEIAYLYEYQSMLGQMRKELPTHDPKVHRSFQLASRTDLTGDSTGKKLAKSSGKMMMALAESLKGTPWEVLAKREKLTALGLEWKPSTEIVGGGGR
jgi:hypothetical protein